MGHQSVAARSTTNHASWGWAQWLSLQSERAQISGLKRMSDDDMGSKPDGKGIEE